MSAITDFFRLGFIRMLSEIRNPVFDFFFLTVTRLGEEFLFMAVALAVFWCGNKKRGYFLLITGFLGTVVNQALKITFRVRRPWQIDPSFEPVASAKPAATGYSMPSGHTQVGSTLYGGIALTAKRRVTMALGIAAVLLIAFSRLYLGVHTLADVLMSLGIGIIILIAFDIVFSYVDKNPRVLYAVSAVMILCALANVIYAECAPAPQTQNPLEYAEEAVHLADAAKNAWSLFGAALAFPFILFFDEKYIRFDGHATLVWQIAKVALGLLLLLGVKEGLKVPMDLLCGDLLFKHAIRYFLTVCAAGIFYPWLFRFIPKKEKTA
ncbi:MAG: phosphatase PAP2 family protein [Clostridia bacterium]|nr:phosphatase PAP2 family protein [Clostridia bacterium]MBR6795265.1 phosphatase PAP2 family protein [Clostridia bacterium]